MADQQDQGCINLRWALALMEGLIGGGMRQLVISPGSRSTPLVLAAQRLPALELTIVLDERSAAFFALGAALASDRPVGLVCTSGSAPAHWLPAVIEASESEIPLILLSADRPPELRGWGANQTIDQTGLFAGYVREFRDPGPAEDTPAGLKMIRTLGLRAAANSLGQPPGPVHLNLPFREPLVPGPDCAVFARGEPSSATTPETQRSDGTASRPRRPEWSWSTGAVPADTPPLASGRGIICCGPGAWTAHAAADLWACAARRDLPVLCDPLSGLRSGPAGPHRITRYDSFLRNPGAAAAVRPDWVLRFGRAPVSKTLMSWLAGIPTVLIDAGERWSDPNHDVSWRIPAEPATVCRWLAWADRAAPQSGSAAADWMRRWTRVEAHVDQFATRYMEQAPWCEAHVITDLLALLPGGEGLLCANSMPIRQLDTWSGSRESRLAVFGNRGASGIDGQTSTLAGLNAGGVPTTGLLGDLSFLHDLSGLQLMRHLPRPCIVINNGGGRIFDYLPQHGLPGFEALWRTPVDVDLRRLIEPFGLAHRSVSNGADFREAMRAALEARRTHPRGQVIEVHVDADLSRQLHQGFWAALRDAEFGVA
ncbi:2-succinyl-5-enolpyruvyl-6-hydroxy-3-cyclohexene-1-carboxylic-acid synthase [Thiocystis violacea]|uniref:2-succinyl-5-enolpyruvyl-6-hydroxy-3- cyclohexene-1-carboxylic-acid synthase n=1 Tax=Thiocystis violacea TaxID=13725 RepID=UPI0019048F85|nr:2-succinyl-5-enolpyruvyl-6-hydroxy-3-cyclohexene-1-carboxylic-acid synthase [Thiocystis violacea]MBK1721493.1 2-succinyl-5-enolpyruvyl-6-hydroxy-3-cyclohexene-1-carboxylic-acid synthase [Thiocystis violacea]